MVSDAHGIDPGGNQVGVLLFVDDGYLFDLEIYSVTGDGFAGLPKAEDLKLSERTEPNEHGARWLSNP